MARQRQGARLGSDIGTLLSPPSAASALSAEAAAAALPLDSVPGLQRQGSGGKGQSTEGRQGGEQAAEEKEAGRDRPAPGQGRREAAHSATAERRRARHGAAPTKGGWVSRRAQP